MTLDMAAKRTLTARLKRYDVCFWQIMLQKSAATDRAVMPFVKGPGFDPPALTPETHINL